MLVANGGAVHAVRHARPANGVVPARHRVSRPHGRRKCLLEGALRAEPTDKFDDAVLAHHHYLAGSDYVGQSVGVAVIRRNPGSTVIDLGRDPPTVVGLVELVEAVV